MEKFDTSNCAYELTKALACLGALYDELDTFEDYVARYENNQNQRNTEAVCYEAMRGVSTWRNLLATARDIVKVQEIVVDDVIPAGGDHNDSEHA